MTMIHDETSARTSTHVPTPTRTERESARKRDKRESKRVTEKRSERTGGTERQRVQRENAWVTLREALHLPFVEGTSARIDDGLWGDKSLRRIWVDKACLVVRRAVNER